MPGLNSIMWIGRSGLNAAQLGIEVTANNIANVNTPGYSRQTLVLEDGIYIDYVPGQLGTGVNAKEVIRHFDKLLERQIIDKLGTVNGLATLYSGLAGIENIFNESYEGGIADAISRFFAAWDALSADPASMPKRQVVVSELSTLISSISQAANSLKNLQDGIDDTIRQAIGGDSSSGTNFGIGRVNEILYQIADVNKQINLHDIPGQNNANSLYDTRDSLVRELASYFDIRILDNGGGDYKVMTAAGHNLVDGMYVISDGYDGKSGPPLQIWESYTRTDLTKNSAFTGKIVHEGTDSREYLIEVMTDGVIATSSNPPTPGAATFRVSYDGGKTWDDNGGAGYLCANRDNRIGVGNLEIYFDEDNGTALSAGDSFNISPHSSLIWHTTAGTPMNITPITYADGSSDPTRLTGGTLGAAFMLRDHYLGKYGDILDNLAKTIAWEVNRLHSQGAGLEFFGTNNIVQASGTYGASRADVPLGSASANLAFGKQLQAGLLTMVVYTKADGQVAQDPDLPNAPEMYYAKALDFGTDPDRVTPFDPAVHTLQDVADAINNTFNDAGPPAVNRIFAQVIPHSDGGYTLQITAVDGYEFGFMNDETGLLAALGINTLITGDNASNLGVNSLVANNLEFLNAGHIDGAYESNEGDNTTAKLIGDLRSKKVEIPPGSGNYANLFDYYAMLITQIGADTSQVKLAFDYQSNLASDLLTQQESIAGVSIDEEMTNLIKYQHAYKAAAKLITTADEMMQVVLSMKS